MIVHPIPPVSDRRSSVLILGSFPSVKSREEGFYYGNPHNRFWKVLARVFSEEVPDTVDDKKAFLLRNQVALWDVIGSCEIEGSSDASIRNVTVNDIGSLLEKTAITKIVINGKTAYRYYQQYLLSVTGINAVCLPSTSPANASWSVERLVGAWGPELKKN